MSEKSSIVWVDMDGTIFDFDQAAIASVPLNLRVARESFYVIDDYPEEFHKQIKDTYRSPDFFENLELFEGVKEGWQAIIDSGRHPRILSAPLTSNPVSVEGKIKSLQKHLVPEFGARVVQEAIFDKNKWKYDGLAIIDDRPDLARGENGQKTATWEHILYGWSDSKNTSIAQASFRLLSWRDTDHLIDTLDIISEAKL